MEFTALNVLAVVRKSHMLSRAHAEIERSLVRLLADDTYTRDTAVERFTGLVRAARIKLGFPVRRGRLKSQDHHEKNVAIDVFLDGFEQEYGYIPDPEPAPQRVHHFTPPKNWKARQRQDLTLPASWFPLGEEDPALTAPLDHEPDLEGVRTSAYYIACSMAGDPRGEIEVPALPDVYAGLSAVDALAQEFRVTVFMESRAQDPYALLSWRSRGLLRRVDTQTYEDYLLDHSDEIADEVALQGFLATNPPGSEGSNGTAGVSLDEMWNDYIRSYDPLRRLQLLTQYAEGREED